MKIAKIQTTPTLKASVSFAQTAKEAKLFTEVPQPEGIKPSKISTGAIIGLCLLGTALVVGMGIKFLPKIKELWKTLFKKTEPVTDEKKYQLITSSDVYNYKEQFHEAYFHPEILNGNSPHANGMIFVGPDSLAKEKLMKELTDRLIEKKWNVVEIPRLDSSKITGTDMANDRYLFDYFQNIIHTFDDAFKKYEETGEKTAIVVRRLDTITRNRSHIEDFEHFKHAITDILLLNTDNINKKGCTWVTDIPLGNLDLDPASIRYGRVDRTVNFLPLEEDSQAIWEDFLSFMKKIYDTDVKILNKTGITFDINNTSWKLQHILDKFPKEYRSSKIYQELNTTKFYPDKYKELVDNAPRVERKPKEKPVGRM